MSKKCIVFLLTGLFLLITTVVSAEPIWVFKTGHTIKYTRVKNDGTSWPVTMTIGAGNQNVCGRTDYFKVDEYNYDNDGQTKSDYLRVTDTEGYNCNTDSGTEIKFIEVGRPEGYGWSYGTDTDGVKFQIVSVTRFGAQIVVRRYEIEGGVNKPPVFTTFVRGYGLMKETDQWVSDNQPWTQSRHGWRGRTLYANFTGVGLYSFDYDGNRTWTKINGVVASKMVNSGPNLYAAFTGYGLYIWDGTVWTKINTIIPDTMISVGWSLYAIFPGYSGLYRFNQNGAWTKINTVTPASMVASGDNLYATFTGYGLYRYDGTTWTKINGVIPASMQQGLN